MAKDPLSKRTTTSQRRYWIALIIGLLVIAVAISPPFDEAVDSAFSAHMLQHVLFVNVAAPLLAFAWPLIFGRWRSSLLVTVLNELARPVPALVISTIAMWAWHYPPFYDFALENEPVHALEHIFFVGTFTLFWRPLMSDDVAKRQLGSNFSRVVYLTISMFAMSLLAAIITFSTRSFYSYYETSTAGGRTPLQDQQLGGGLMWIAGIVCMVVIAIATMREE